MTHLPEGAELYEWHAAPVGWSSMSFHVHQAPAIIAYEDLDLPMDLPETVTICPTHGPYGWSEELRIGVAFAGAPMPTFEESVITDDDSNILRVLRELLDLINRDNHDPLRGYLSELDEADEGEEWRDG